MLSDIIAMSSREISQRYNLHEFNLRFAALDNRLFPLAGLTIYYRREALICYRDNKADHLCNLIMTAVKAKSI